MKAKIIILVVLVILVTSGVVFGKKILNLNQSDGNDIATPTSDDIRPIVVKIGESAIFGRYLTDKNGMTLYVFSDDTESKANCEKECLAKWKIYEFDNLTLIGINDEQSKRVRVMTRSDGFQQFTYDKKPLYYYIGDEKPGEINGVDEKIVGSKWSVVIPQ